MNSDSFSHFFFFFLKFIKASTTQVFSLLKLTFFSHFCGVLDVFLPLHEIYEGMNYLKTVVPPETNELQQYFVCRYIRYGNIQKCWFRECIKPR